MYDKCVVCVCVSEPQAPGAPQNLTEGQTVIKDNKLSVTIHWLAPKKSDLPIARYKVRTPNTIANTSDLPIARYKVRTPSTISNTT